MDTLENQTVTKMEIHSSIIFWLSFVFWILFTTWTNY